MQRIRRLFDFDAPTSVDWAILFLGFILLLTPAIINFYFNHGEGNSYSLFAQSLLHGKIHMPPIKELGDLALFNGKVYLPYPPLPSIILLPFVALFGAAGVNTVAVATLMGCISVYLFYKILSRLQIAREYFIWLILAMIFGTGYWYSLFTSHHVYAFAHVTSFLFQLLIINEILGKRRWWLVGIYIGCTFLTRQFTLFYFVFAVGYMLYLNQQQKDTARTRHFFQLSMSTAFFIILYLFYNYWRFGNFFDTGYKHILFVGVLKERVDKYGIFSIHYFLYNFYQLFLSGFQIEFKGNTNLQIRDMNLWGTSLLAASPFLIASLKASWPRMLKVAAWTTILVILTGQLFYHNNGFHQINTSRFSLDFLPLLLVLAALGISSLPKWLLKGLIIYAVLLNVIAFLIHSIYQ